MSSKNKSIFVSFSDLGHSNSDLLNVVAAVPELTLTSPIYTGNDEELSVICKKLSKKKDTITRCKAISELMELLNVCLFYLVI